MGAKLIKGKGGIRKAQDVSIGFSDIFPVEGCNIVKRMAFCDTCGAAVAEHLMEKHCDWHVRVVYFFPEKPNY